MYNIFQLVNSRSDFWDTDRVSYTQQQCSLNRIRTPDYINLHRKIFRFAKIIDEYYDIFKTCRFSNCLPQALFIKRKVLNRSHICFSTFKGERIGSPF